MAAGRKVKIPIIGTVNKTVFIDPNATRGATLGMDLFTPDGEVGTPDTVREWLGLTPLPPTNVEDDSGDGTTHHRLLEGLTLGDDHPQYTQWAQNEEIVKSWAWNSPDGIPDPQHAADTSYEQLFLHNPDVTSHRAGLQFTTLTGVVDPSANGAGSQIAFWEVENLYGFRIRNAGHIDNQGDLDFYRHANDATGVLFMRFTRDSSQAQFAAGSLAAPTITTFNALTTGMWFPNANSITLSIGGSTEFALTTGGTAAVTSGFIFRAPNGTDSAPAYSFDGDTNTGMYRGVGTSNSIGFSTDGIERFSIGNTDTSGGGLSRGIRSTLSLRGPAGSATVPTFTFTTDDNTGWYSVGADQLGVSVGGTLRATWTTAALVMTVPVSAANGSASAPSFAFTNDLDSGMYRVGTDILGFATAGAVRFQIDAGGAFGLGGASYGSAGQVLTSAGSGAPPVWSSAGSGVVSTIVAGDGILVDDTDPVNPIVAVDEAFAFNWTADHTFADQVTVGNGAQAEAGPILQVVNSADTLLTLYRFNNVSGGSAITMSKSRNATPGAHTIVQSGDSVFRMIGRGSDGSAFIPCAEIRFLIDATPGANDMPGRIVFYTTPDGSATQTERMRINDGGALGFNGANFGTSGQILESQGSGGPPAWVDPPSGTTGVTVDVYTANDTWTKPANTAWVEVICIGGGGGGGGGRKQATSQTRSGGGGGGGGGYSRAAVQAADLAATVGVVVGGGGGGGAGASADTGTGTNGSNGGTSSFGTLIRALGGALGNGSTAATNPGGAGGGGKDSSGGTGGTGGTSTSTVGGDCDYGGGGGGGGGGVSSANNESGGKAGGIPTYTGTPLTGGTAGAAGGTNGGTGGSVGDDPAPGAGGGGGGGEIDAGSSGGDGGDGGNYGGGGGGGGGCTNGAGIAGDGGDGAGGVVVVVSYPS